MNYPIRKSKVDEKVHTTPYSNTQFKDTNDYVTTHERVPITRKP